MSGPRPLILKPAARRDVDRIMDGYRAEAGERLAESVGVALGSAVRMPANVFKSRLQGIDPALGLPDLRFWPIRKFPHLVFYLTASAFSRPYAVQNSFGRHVNQGVN